MAKKKQPTTSQKPKVDIFGVLRDINSGDREFYTKLPDDHQKTLHPFVLTRWMAGTKNPMQLVLLNNTVNKYNFALANHKRLLMDMLLVSGSKGARHQWHPGVKRTSTTGALERLFREYYKCSPREAAMYSKMGVDTDTILKMAQHVGWQEDEIDKLKLK